MPMPVRHLRPALPGTACHVACGAPLPPNARHTPQSCPAISPVSTSCMPVYAGRWSVVGLRLDETYGLRPGDVDFMRRIVHPQVQYQAEDSRPRFPGLPSRSRYRWLLSCLLTSQGTARYGTLLTGEYGYQLPPWAPKRATRTARKKVQDLPAGFRIWPDRDESTRIAVEAVIAARTEQCRNSGEQTTRQRRSRLV